VAVDWQEPMVLQRYAAIHCTRWPLIGKSQWCCSAMLPSTARVAVDWQEPMVLQRYAAIHCTRYQTIGCMAATSKHTTTPINHIRPSPYKHSTGGAT